MKKKRTAFIKALLPMVLAAAVITGCSKTSTTTASTESDSSSASSSGTLQRVLQDKVLRVGVTRAEPFAMENENGELEGYDVDLANALAESLNVEADIQMLSLDARVSSLQTNLVDIVFGDFTATLERYQSISFSDPYTATGVRLLVRADNDSINSLADCDGLTIGIVKGSANQMVCEQYMEDNGINFEITFLDQHEDCVAALRNEQIDVFIEDGQYLEYIASQYPDDLKVVGDSLTAETYICAGLQKGDSDWKDYVDWFIFTINTDGTNQELYKKWFGTEMTIPLNPQY